MGRARPGTELQLVGDPEDERRRSSGCLSCQGPACACMSPRGAKMRDSYGLKRSSSGAATCPPSLAAVQAEKERMKVEISSMLKSFEEQTYQIALGMA